jgi:hypothetical protein
MLRGSLVKIDHFQIRPLTSVRLALDALHGQHHAQRDRHVGRVGAGRSVSEQRGDAAPGRSLAMILRQLLYRLPHVGERRSVMTLGMTSGRGRGRDQFGRGKDYSWQATSSNVAELVAIPSWETAPTSAFT